MFFYYFNKLRHFLKSAVINSKIVYNGNMEMTDLFKDKPFYSKTALYDMGFSWYQIDKFTKEGILKKLNCHIYESTLYDDVVNDFSYVQVFVPDGVICQLSAAYYYGYTNYMPNNIEVSIPRNK